MVYVLQDVKKKYLIIDAFTLLLEKLTKYSEVTSTEYNRI